MTYSDLKFKSDWKQQHTSWYWNCEKGFDHKWWQAKIMVWVVAYLQGFASFFHCFESQDVCQQDDVYQVQTWDLFQITSATWNLIENPKIHSINHFNHPILLTMELEKPIRMTTICHGVHVIKIKYWTEAQILC